ncbi:hypothetical protein BC826DRAFT_969445 [Russula brevipes]|nr:hypothetical protein BC826DRAFT_969445 [Russula brevipes]
MGSPRGCSDNASQSLLNFIIRRPPTERDVRPLAQQLAHTLSLLHAHSVMHRNLKLENAFIGPTITFGGRRAILRDFTSFTGVTASDQRPGTPLMARASEQFSPAPVATRHANDGAERTDSIRRDLLRCMPQADPISRASLDDVLNHPWVKPVVRIAALGHRNGDDAWGCLADALELVSHLCEEQSHSGSQTHPLADSFDSQNRPWPQLAKIRSRAVLCPTPVPPAEEAPDKCLALASLARVIPPFVSVDKVWGLWALSNRGHVESSPSAPRPFDRTRDRKQI